MKSLVTSCRLLLVSITASAIGWSLPTAAETARITRPVKLVIGYSAGGSTDILARKIAEDLHGLIGQPVVVDNKPGASGSLASLAVKSAAADGTTLLLQPMAPMVLVPQIYRNSKVDPRKDFVPIAEIASIPLAVAVNPQSGMNTMADVAAATKKQKNGAQYAMPGVGGLAHMLGAQLALSGSFNWSPVAYKAAMSYMSELASGDIIAAIDLLPELVSMSQSGKLRVVGVSTPARSSLFPNVPTFQEQGFKEAQVANWFGVFAPAGTSPELVAYLNEKINVALSKPESVKRLKELGFEPKISKPADLAKTLSDDYVRWGAVLKTLKLEE